MTEPAEAMLARMARFKALPQDVGTPIAAVCKAVAREWPKMDKRTAALAAVLEEALPPNLLPHCKIVGLRAGILHVAADSASHHYALRQELLLGLEARLIAARQGVRRVKTTIKS